MIAKIGYGYFVAANGPVELESVPVLPFIEGERADGDLWVGSATFQTQSERMGALHSLALVKPRSSTLGTIAHVARVKLFAAFGAGGYEVVTHVSRQNLDSGTNMPA
jgi:hypothetical protein